MCSVASLLVCAFAAAFAIAAATPATSNGKKYARYDGDQVLRIYPVNSNHWKKIKEINRDNRGQKWASNTAFVDLLFRKEWLEDVKESLANASMDFRVLVDDVQKAIDQENPPMEADEFNNFRSKMGHRLTFENYHRMSDVYEFLDYLATSRPNYVNVITIGQTSEGRPIKLIKISSGQPNAIQYWIDGGTHAREWITVATVSYIINKLVNIRESLDKNLRNIDFHIVPILNPDGYEYSHEKDRLWRKNRRPNKGTDCVGTDLNRNWDYGWGGQGAGTHPCIEIYSGSGPFSELETIAVANYIMQSPFKFEAFVTFHSYGQYVMYPWGYATTYPPDVQDLHRVGYVAANAMRQSGGLSYTVGSPAVLLNPAAGGSIDWAKGSAKIKYSYAIELRDTGKHGFLLPASNILPSGREAFASIMAIAKEL